MTIRKKGYLGEREIKQILAIMNGKAYVGQIETEKILKMEMIE